MFFNPAEISTMLSQYSQEKNVQMDIQKLSERIFYYTSGYPFLVSKMCKVIDEILLPEKENHTEWTIDEVENSFKYLVKDDYMTTIFDDLTKNVDNNPDIKQLLTNILMAGLKVPFITSDQTISLAKVYGMLDTDGTYCKIHNRIFEQKLYNHLLVGMIITGKYNKLSASSDVYSTYEGTLDMPKILRKFQEFMKENYSQKDADFIEREGRLIFLSFLKPIINGRGFDFKDPNIGEERRMDIVITYTTNIYILELKVWRDESYHQKGLEQLSEYLDLYNKKEGFLLIFNFNQHKKFKEENIELGDKNILAIWV